MLTLLAAMSFSSWSSDNYREYFKLPSSKEHYVSPTKYNWSKVAASLTKDCQSDYDKLYSIYSWITRNIEYDTSYSIYTADDCFDNRKGVCQAYSELFYRIAEAAGLHVEIIWGESRTNKYGRHAWLFGYTRENHGILIDATWGAGSVNGNTFRFRENHDVWFNVDPEWMIVSHLPDEVSYQLLETPMTKEDFHKITLDWTAILAYEYGMDTHQLYQSLRKHKLALPYFYSGGEGIIKLTDIPRQESLQLGKQYIFKIEALQPCVLVLIHGNNWFSAKSGEWVDEGDGVYSICYTPDAAGELYLSIMNNQGTASRLVSYKVQ